jgi:hypothetical protein
MRSIIKRWLPSALLAAFLLTGASVAQPPGQKDRPPKVPSQPTRISVDEIVERIMAFDKNKDGKITRDELPERMQHLIDLGDTNKDGALDREEVRKLVTSANASGGFGDRAGGFGFGGRVEGVGRGFGLGGPPDVGFGGPYPGGIEGVVEDLKLSAKKKEEAMNAVKTHQENVRKLMDQARAELLEKMKGILSEEELKDFEAALDRPRGVTVINLEPKDASKGGIERKVEAPPK